jgi:hypothetical protein
LLKQSVTEETKVTKTRTLIWLVVLATITAALIAFAGIVFWPDRGDDEIGPPKTLKIP